jgi:hypothetical protein
MVTGFLIGFDIKQRWIMPSPIFIQPLSNYCTILSKGISVGALLCYDLPVIGCYG